MSRKVLFVINPKAGVKRKINFEAFIKENFNPQIPYEISVWDPVESYPEIHRRITSGEYTDAVSVGGDGTMNRVAQSVTGTSVRLGILPLGSGNGLARTLGIPMNLKEALKVIEKGNSRLIDSGRINSQGFVCTAGIGFDAHIGNCFATSETRGLKTYVKITIRELFTYSCKEYTLKMNNLSITRKVFLITAANAGQWGNNVYIAPEAKVDDGKLHIAVVKRFPWYMAVPFAMKLLSGRAHKSRYVETFVTEKLTIFGPEPGAIHFDGEPELAGMEISIGVLPKSIRVLC